MINLFFLSIVSLIFLRIFIHYAKRYFPAGVRDDLTMGEHQTKGKTPSMGGIIFLIPVLWLYIFHKHQPEAWFIIIATTTSALVGLWDDLFKIFKKKGLSVKNKFCLQATGAALAALYFYNYSFSNTISFGFFSLKIGFLWVLWATLVIIATSHAVNLTDGLDGLAGIHSLTTLAGFFAIACYCAPTQGLIVSWYAAYLMVALVIFLCYNRYPAKIIMGDVGALSLGAYIASLFLLLHWEISLLFLGSFFVFETLSVIVQYIAYRYFKKRIFLCAPFHHHLEKKGYHETTIVNYSAIISIVSNACFIFLIKHYFCL